MDLIARFGRYSVDTYGGAPLLLAITLVQLTLLGWTFAQAWKARGDRIAPALSPDVRRIRAARRAEIWEKHVRPLALTMMLLGPGLGLGMSTLLGALGMGALGDAMGTQAGAETLAATMASAYREISYAYFLMVGGTFPMLLGPVIVLAARRLDQDASALNPPASSPPPLSLPLRIKAAKASTLGWSADLYALTILVSNVSLRQEDGALLARAGEPVVAVCAEYDRPLASLDPPELSRHSLASARTEGVPTP